MRSYQDVEVAYPSHTNSYYNNGISLVKLSGYKIVDMLCRLGDEYSDTALTVKAIILEDGRTLWLQGEHDIVYVHNYGDNLTLPKEEELQNIYNTDPDNQ